MSWARLDLTSRSLRSVIRAFIRPITTRLRTPIATSRSAPTRNPNSSFLWTLNLARATASTAGRSQPVKRGRRGSGGSGAPLVSTDSGLDERGTTQLASAAARDYRYTPATTMVGRGGDIGLAGLPGSPSRGRRMEGHEEPVGPVSRWVAGSALPLHV